MILKIKSTIPIRYSQEDIQQLCVSFGVSYIRHEQSDYSIDLTIGENLSSEQISLIKNGLIQQVLSKIIEIEQ